MRRSLLAPGVLAVTLLTPSLLALGACSGPQDHLPALPQPCPTSTTDPRAENGPPSVPAPASVAAAEGRVTTIGSPADIPLTGPRVDGKAGDRMIDNGLAAVVVTMEGRIADYGLKGARDEMAHWTKARLLGVGSLRRRSPRPIGEQRCLRQSPAAG